MSMLLHQAEPRPGNPAPQFDSFHVDLPGRIVLIGHHLSTAQSYRCIIHDISMGGAVLDVNHAVRIPKNFYLNIDGIQDEIGCSQVTRYGNWLSVSFNMLLNKDFLHTVLKMGR